MEVLVVPDLAICFILVGPILPHKDFDWLIQMKMPINKSVSREASHIRFSIIRRMGHASLCQTVLVHAGRSGTLGRCATRPHRQLLYGTNEHRTVHSILAIIKSMACVFLNNDNIISLNRASLCVMRHGKMKAECI